MHECNTEEEIERLNTPVAETWTTAVKLSVQAKDLGIAFGLPAVHQCNIQQLRGSCGLQAYHINVCRDYLSPRKVTWAEAVRDISTSMGEAPSASVPPLLAGVASLASDGKSSNRPTAYTTWSTQSCLNLLSALGAAVSTKQA